MDCEKLQVALTGVFRLLGGRKSELLKSLGGQQEDLEVYTLKLISDLRKKRADVAAVKGMKGASPDAGMNSTLYRHVTEALSWFQSGAGDTFIMPDTKRELMAELEQIKGMIEGR